MHRTAAGVAALSLLAMSLPAQDRKQARSMVVTPHGIVATSQTLASQAGAQVLARGGNAIDAAIAANAAMGAVEPMSNGIGGDLFVIYWDAKSGKLSGLNASGWSPKNYTLDYLKSKGYQSAPDAGIDSVSVPGVVSGWEKLHRKFGRMKWADVFQPAIHLAERGFPVTEIIADVWRNARMTLLRDERSQPIFLPGQRTPELGQMFKNADLGKAYRAIARDGAAAFYRGPIAKAIVEASKRAGGVMEAADLAEFDAEWVEPISTEYRGWKVYELPPNGQGIATLQMLNIMEQFPLDRFEPESADALHWKIEAQKLAYADLKRYVADPRFATMPVAGLLSAKYAQERAKLIDRNRASCDVTPGKPPSGTGDTIYLSVVDRDGNIVSLIQSLYLSFGSGVVVDGYGFHLQNRAGLFEMDAAHPNAAGPRKRPFHTIIPGFAESGSRHIGFGIMGGFNQAQAHAQFISNVVDGGMNIQGALEAPRFTKLNFGGCDLYMENRVSESERRDLERRGHRIELLGAYSGVVGGGQAVMHDSETKINYGASSPRKDGAAIPEPPAYWEK